jgi:maltooligosyltrehalose trehalohydrolase
MAEATATGRVKEFAEHGWNADDVVNPQDPDAFTSAKLRWAERDDPEHAEILALYRQLLRLRREQPDLADSRLDLVEVDVDEDAQWIVIRRGAFEVLANLADQAQDLPVASGDVLFGTEPGLRTNGRTITLPARSAAITGQIGAAGF